MWESALVNISIRQCDKQTPHIVKVPKVNLYTTKQKDLINTSIAATQTSKAMEKEIHTAAATHTTKTTDNESTTLLAHKSRVRRGCTVNCTVS